MLHRNRDVDECQACVFIDYMCLCQFPRTPGEDMLPVKWESLPSSQSFRWEMSCNFTVTFRFARQGYHNSHIDLHPKQAIIPLYLWPGRKLPAGDEEHARLLRT